MSTATSGDLRRQPLSPLTILSGSALVTIVSYGLLHYTAIMPQIVYGALLALMLFFIATSLIHRTVVVMIGAGVCLFLAAAGGHLSGGHGSGLPAYVYMVEWSAIGIIIGATIFVELASKSGVFSYLSIRLLKVSGGRPVLLLFFFALLTLLFAAFLDNVTAMIIVGSLTIIAADKLDLNPIPFVVTEALMTNIGGTMTLISSIPNIIIATQAGLSYITILYMMTGYALIALMASVVVAIVLFPDTFRSEGGDSEQRSERVQEFDEWDTVNDRTFFVVSIVAVIGFIAAFALHGVLPVIHQLPVEWIALAFGTIMLVVYPADVEETLEDIEWNLVAFFAGLFTIVGVMKDVGVLSEIARAMQPFLDSGEIAGPSFLAWSSALLSGLTNNIPLSAMFAEIIAGMEGSLPDGPFWWALILGANIGGNFTPIGSVSTMVGMTVLRSEGYDFTFLQFVKVGAIFAGIQLIIANLYLLLL